MLLILKFTIASHLPAGVDDKLLALEQQLSPELLPSVGVGAHSVASRFQAKLLG